MNTIYLPNGHPLRLVASDMDGTMLQSDQTIDPATRDRLRRYQEMGIRVVLISGRPIPAMVEYGRILGLDHHDGVLIGINGGHAYSYTTNQDLWAHTVPMEAAETFFRAWKPFGLTMISYERERILMDVPEDAAEVMHLGFPLEEGLKLLEEATNMGVVRTDLTKGLDHAPLKVCISGPHAKILQAQKQIRHLYEKELYGAFSAETYFETMQRGINKGTALQEYADSFGIRPEEIIAFGDQDNDIPMLAYAGVGVAMEKASHGLIKTASHRTGSNNAGGIGDFLARLERGER